MSNKKDLLPWLISIMVDSHLYNTNIQEKYVDTKRIAAIR